MSSLKFLIRKIILESINQARWDSEKSLFDNESLLNRDEQMEYYNIIKSTKNRSYKRLMKSFWNKIAYKYAADFWKSDEVQAIHWIGLVKYGDQIPIEEQLNKYLTRKSDLSCIGYLKNQWEIEDIIPISDCGFLLSPRRITFASKGDAYTEFLRSANKSVNKFYRNKLPKRPWVNMPSEYILFEEHDIPSNGKISELIVSNWKISKVLINDNSNKINVIINWCKSNNLEYIII